MTTVKISRARLDEALARNLQHGSHGSWEGGSCVMEAVAYVAGERWSDHPKCVSPVLGAFLRSWNDGLPTDEDRDRLLKPFIHRVVGTAGDGHDDTRAWMAVDFQVRVQAPVWLDLAGLTEHAASLRGLPEITLAARETWDGPLKAARSDAAAAWDAAGAAAGDAAWDAAWAAAGAAAWAAARAAAGAAAWDAAGAAARDAAWDAAGAAAGAAARDAAWAAAWAAARDALAPSVPGLQDEAVKLLERMVALGEGERMVVINGSIGGSSGQTQEPSA